MNLKWFKRGKSAGQAASSKNLSEDEKQAGWLFQLESTKLPQKTGKNKRAIVITFAQKDPPRIHLKLKKERKTSLDSIKKKKIKIQKCSLCLILETIS